MTIRCLLGLALGGALVLSAQTVPAQSAAASLERLITHLDHPKRPDTLDDGARADLSSQAEEILTAID